MIRIKNVVYPVVAVVAVALVAWQPMETSIIRKIGTPVERSVSSDMADWLLPVSMFAPSASSEG